MNTKSLSFLLLPALASGSLFLTSCENLNEGSGALIGAVSGAAYGAIVNDDDRKDEIWKGAAIGAGIGALVGHAKKAKRYENAGGNPQPVSDYPAGTRTDQANYVRSPYPPHNVIDVTGFRPGELAIDPTTNQVFRVP